METELPLIGAIHVDRLMLEIVVVLAAAVAAGMTARAIGVSTIVGYIAAGVVLGPGVTGFLAEDAALSLLGEVGVALLLFTVGLELRWHSLRRLAHTAAVAGSVQILVTAALAYLLATFLGVSSSIAIVVSLAIPLSSTAVVLRTLTDRGELDTVHGQAALGVLVAQDLAAVPILVLVDRIADSNHGISYVAERSAGAGLSIAILIGCVLIADRLILRRAISRSRIGIDHEILSITCLTLTLTAIGAADVLGLPAAVGGFIAGVILGDAPYSDRLRSEIAPLRYALIAVFFARIGALVQPSWIGAHASLVAGTLAFVVIAKASVAYMATRVAGIATPPSLITAIALAQIGELSFVVVSEATHVGVLSNDGFQLFVSVSAASLLLTPFLIDAAVRVALRSKREALGLAEHSNEELSDHAVVIGYSICGRAVVEELIELGVPTVVIDADVNIARVPRHVERLILGEGSSTDVLRDAGVAKARLVVVAMSGPLMATLVVRSVRRLAPDGRIIARCRHHRFIDQIQSSGATVIVDEEHESGRALARSVDRELGAA